jgi:hypothetical protein
LEKAVPEPSSYVLVSVRIPGENPSTALQSTDLLHYIENSKEQCMSIRHIVTALTITFILPPSSTAATAREKSLINNDWRFTKADPPAITVDLSCARLQSWILPTGNLFIRDAGRRFPVPNNIFPDSILYAEADSDNSAWRPFNLPHDWRKDRKLKLPIKGILSTSMSAP